MRTSPLTTVASITLLSGLLALAGCSGDDDNGAVPTVPSPTPTPQPPTFQGLGTLPGRVSSVAFGLSADGTAVVGSSYDAQNVGQAFRWTAEQGLLGLGNLPDRPNSEAYGASAGGMVVGGLSAFADLFEAFRWTMADGIEPLAVDASDSPPETVNGVSSDGSVLVGAANFSFADPVAFRWTVAGGLEELGFLSGSSGASEAHAISPDGAVIVGQSTADMEMIVAFRWTESGGMVGLPQPPDAIASVAFAISADGSVAVGSGNLDPQTFKATMWSDGGAAFLGDLPGGEQRNVARGVSENGARIVGEVIFHEMGEQVAFIWDSSNGMRRLQDVLAAAGLGEALSGWTLQNAAGVSSNGTVIAGTGMNPSGQREAFVATLP